MMTGNKPTSTGAPSGDAPACGASVQDLSVLDLSVRGRLEWIDEQVAVVAVAIVRQVPRGGSVSSDAWQILAVVNEFAELLRVHFAGVEL
jgi:hypothetical protein